MEHEKDSGRYPIIKHPGQVVPRPEEERVERGASGRLSPDAVQMIAGGGPAAVRPRVHKVLKTPSSPVKPPQNPNSQKR